MADYISQLNGEQMDAALMDVALHNSEAWAVGTRNGYDVEQGDATYHNNAKYYAQVAQSAIPGTYTAAVRWDIDQGLAGEAQEQARANISAGASNRNLLDNPFFTIRQMGTGGITGVGYAVDRWKNTGGANLTQTPRSPYGITFASSSGYQVDQALWACSAEYLDGKTLTLSVMTNGGKVAQATGTFTATSSTTAKIYVVSADGNFALGLYYIPSSRAVPFIRVTTPSGKFPVNAPILAAKLELGSYSTLANDVPPDYGEELRKYKYYFRRITVQDNGFIALGWATSATAAQFPNILGTDSMRIKPTATPTGAVYVRDPSGTDHAVSSFTVQYDPDAVCLQANTSGLTANTVVRLRIGAGGRIDLSADL